MPRYEITIDNDSISELTDLYAPDPIRALVHFANAALPANAFTNIAVVESRDTHLFFAADVTLQFDATADDAARYVAYYDADPEILTIV